MMCLCRLLCPPHESPGCPLLQVGLSQPSLPPFHLLDEKIIYLVLYSGRRENIRVLQEQKGK